MDPNQIEIDRKEYATIVPDKKLRVTRYVDDGDVVLQFTVAEPAVTRDATSIRIPFPQPLAQPFSLDQHALRNGLSAYYDATLSDGVWQQVVRETTQRANPSGEEVGRYQRLITASLEAA